MQQQLLMGLTNAGERWIDLAATTTQPLLCAFSNMCATNHRLF